MVYRIQMLKSRTVVYSSVQKVLPLKEIKQNGAVALIGLLVQKVLLPKAA